MKTKIIPFLILSFTFLFANHLTVKNGDATVLINGQEFKIPEDHNLTVKSGTMICFVKGAGTVIIDNKVKLNSKNPECYQIPLNSDADINTLLSSIGDEAVISTEQKKAPSSRPVRRSTPINPAPTAGLEFPINRRTSSRRWICCLWIMNN